MSENNIETTQEKISTTKESLLEAAGNIFAQKGYRATTVREISKSAKANLASINYYFGNKKRLYYEVIKHAIDTAIKRFPPEMNTEEKAPLEKRLRAFIRSFLLRILDEGRPTWHGKLLAREIAEPSFALDHIAEDYFHPLHKTLSCIVNEFFGKTKVDKRTRLCMFSIIGQCLFYRHSRSIISKLYPQEFGQHEIESLADHITLFSLAAIKSLSKTK